MPPVQAQVPATDAPEPIVPQPARPGIDLTINGERFRHTGDPAMPLLWYLRDVLQLTGTKYGDDEGITGADLVLLDGKPVSSIGVAMSALSERSVTTVEGLASPDGRLHPLQQAFIDEDAIGCGYCTPGWLIAGVALLAHTPHPTDEDIDRLPNRCRCGCQSRVRRAIKRAAGARA